MDPRGSLNILFLLGLATHQLGATAPVRLPTSEIAIVGRFARGPVDWPVLVGPHEFSGYFGSDNPTVWPAELQCLQYFTNGGSYLQVVRVAPEVDLAAALSGGPATLTGVHALEQLSDLRVVMVPELSLVANAAFASTFAQFRSFLEPRRTFLLLDPPPDLGSAASIVDWVGNALPNDAGFCAIYFPYLRWTLDGASVVTGASGAMAAIYARNDTANGIWRSPAGTGWPIYATGLSPTLTTSDFALLQDNHINAIRQFSGTGIVPFAARTLNRVASEDLYIAVVRTRGWMADSVERTLSFAAVHDNDTALWTDIRTVVEDFLGTLFREGAFPGATPEEAFFVRCDATTTTPADVAAHRVNVLYGVALLRAGEFDLTRLSAPTYDPERPPPAPRILIGPWRGNLELAYPTAAGLKYYLQRSDALEAGGWNMFDPADNGDGAWRRAVIPMSGSSEFFQIRLDPIR